MGRVEDQRDGEGAGGERRTADRPVAQPAASDVQPHDRVLEVDQTPIGKTPRSCPATYIGFWDTIRKLFADTLEAKARGYSPEWGYPRARSCWSNTLPPFESRAPIDTLLMCR